MNEKELKRLRKKIDRRSITDEEKRTYDAWATARNKNRKVGRKVLTATELLARGAKITPVVTGSQQAPDGPVFTADTASPASSDGPPPLGLPSDEKTKEKIPAPPLDISDTHKLIAENIVGVVKMADVYSLSRGGIGFGPQSALWLFFEKSVTRMAARYLPNLDGDGEEFDQYVVGGIAGAVVGQAAFIAATGKPPLAMPMAFGTPAAAPSGPPATPAEPKRAAPQDSEGGPPPQTTAGVFRS
jgi:hypothetical protein